ncbi:MAG: hypothetical protein AAB529_02660 [Patescibacteria group bacterium]
MNKKLFLFLSVPLYLAIAFPALAAEMETPKGFSIIINLITLIIIGGIMYNLWVNLNGFGGTLGKSLKIIGAGIFLLSIDTIHSSIQEIPGVGLDFLFGQGLYHDYFDCIIRLIGFFVLGFGIVNLSKLVKTMKG